MCLECITLHYFPITGHPGEVYPTNTTVTNKNSIIVFSLFGCIKIFLCGTLSVLFLRWTHFLFEHNNVILWAGLRARAEKYLNAWLTLSIRSFFKRSSHDLDGLLSYQCLFLRFIEVIGNT
jgi:hypothetical protein